MPAYLMVEGDENGAARLLSQELPAGCRVVGERLEVTAAASPGTGRETALVRAAGRRLDRWERRGRVEVVWRRSEELDGRVWAAVPRVLDGLWEVAGASRGAI